MNSVSLGMTLPEDNDDVGDGDGDDVDDSCHFIDNVLTLHNYHFCYFKF